MCVPVLRDGAPIALLYATRNTPRPFGAGVVEIATIFASHFGAALDNASLYQQLRRRATRYPLTGLANRELAIQRLDHALADGSAAFTGLLFCDLDGFKAVNDRLGHEAGDELLQQVAVRLKRGLRPDDLIARRSHPMCTFHSPTRQARSFPSARGSWNRHAANSRRGTSCQDGRTCG
jgi:GAF domain-containing protein